MFDRQNSASAPVSDPFLDSDGWDATLGQTEVLDLYRSAGLCVDSEPDPNRLPASLDGLEPGVLLGCALASVNLEQLDGYDRVVVLRAHQRQTSHHQAGSYQAMAGIAHVYTGLDDDLESAVQGAATKIRAALRLTRRSADTELNLALDLTERLPDVWKALRSGQIDGRRARILSEAPATSPPKPHGTSSTRCFVTPQGSLPGNSVNGSGASASTSTPTTPGNATTMPCKTVGSG